MREEPLAGSTQPFIAGYWFAGAAPVEHLPPFRVNTRGSSPWELRGVPPPAIPDWLPRRATRLPRVSRNAASLQERRRNALLCPSARVMPTVGRANIHLTTAMIAEKMAEHLKQSVKFHAIRNP